MTCCWLTGDPIANIKLLEDPGKNLLVTMGAKQTRRGLVSMSANDP
jgi:hypothetical protein